jgi:hypothetical protein
LKEKSGVEFSRVNLIDDIRAGTARARKIKVENSRTHGKTSFPLDKPPQIFIRRAVDS